MTYFFRDNDIKGLNCRMCSRMYRSGLGLFTHLENCGVEQKRVECEYCKKSYTKLSLASHIRGCAQRLRAEAEANNTNNDIEESNELNVMGRKKRTSQIRAETKLKTFEESLKAFDPMEHIKLESTYPTEAQRNRFETDLETLGKCFCPIKLCRFTCENMETMEAHINECKYIPKPGYHCLICQRSFAIFAELPMALQHMKEVHEPRAVTDVDTSDCVIPTDEEEDDDDDCSDEVDSNAEEFVTCEEIETGGKKNAKKNAKGGKTAAAHKTGQIRVLNKAPVVYPSNKGMLKSINL